MSGIAKHIRPNSRKATDEELITYNALGLSLRAIGKALGLHPTTVQKRLTDLGVPLADTRRAFMDSLIQRLNPDEKQWIADRLGPSVNIQDLFVNMIKERYLQERSSSKTQNQ